MIGDSWESDIEGAQNFGIDQAFFNIDEVNIDDKKSANLFNKGIEGIIRHILIVKDPEINSG